MTTRVGDLLVLLASDVQLLASDTVSVVGKGKLIIGRGPIIIAEIDLDKGTISRRMTEAQAEDACTTAIFKEAKNEPL